MYTNNGKYLAIKYQKYTSECKMQYMILKYDLELI